MSQVAVKPNYYERPKVRIDERRILELIRSGIDPVIARIDLEAVKLKLQAATDWPLDRCDLAELEYKRFLTLILWNKGLNHPIVPTVFVDEIWHKHILDTRAYHEDMAYIFGEYLHHFPFLGFHSEESKRLKAVVFAKSLELYKTTFGEAFDARLLNPEKEFDLPI